MMMLPTPASAARSAIACGDSAAWLALGSPIGWRPRRSMLNATRREPSPAQISSSAPKLVSVSSPITTVEAPRPNAARALSTGFNDTPEKASRPYDKDRDGFVMGAGAGVVMLEEYEHAKARGAKIYGEVVGYGLSGDAFHITAPAEDGDGGFRAMAMAMKRAGLQPSDIDYVNAHGTSTMADGIELGAVERFLGNAAGKVSMSSTKSAIGHLLGAAGAVEAIFCLLAIRDQIVPPTLNLDNPAVETKMDLVPHKAKKREVKAALSNSFGFGGTNASLIVAQVQ